MNTNSTQKKALCVLSGGLDSAVCLGIANDEFAQVSVMFFNYGQKTYQREKRSVEKLVRHYQISDFQEIDLPWLKEFGGSAIFDKNLPLTPTTKKLEYVPFRNSILLSIATAYAESKGISAIFIGSAGSDHICPDNSPQYLKTFQNLIAQGTMMKKDIELRAPLINGDKKMAIEIAQKLKIPLQYTWSCHNNVDEACGVCSNCRARVEAFQQVGLKDPITYVKTKDE